MQLRIHRFLPKTSVEGPGARACLWVQGCLIRCHGCFNPSTWRASGGQVVQVGDLLNRVVRISGIEGATFLGGEPFDQAPALAALAQSVQDAGLSVMTFSGYEYEVLRRADRAGWKDLLAATDLLVDGPFVSSLPDHQRPWVGSTNQQFRFLSSRYRHLADELGSIPDRLEVRLRRDGTVLINGMASSAVLDDLGSAIGRRQRQTQGGFVAASTLG
ncbi:MAG: radical SAM protein [Thermoleophilaceae bacterium]|nr:radical SAM protein [Thermoleophilaceae bacterium]